MVLQGVRSRPLEQGTALNRQGAKTRPVNEVSGDGDFSTFRGHTYSHQAVP